jgi:OOP family OmpA-OmpF porin
MNRTPAFRTPLGWLAACLLAVAGFCHPAWAAQDVANSKDHPLLSRYPQSHIAEYEKNFNAVPFTVGPDKKQTVEGEATQIHYFHNDADKQPSALQLIRNYQNAVKAIGGEVIYERLPRDGDGGETTLKVRANGKDHWIRVEPGIFSAPAQSYKLQLVEVAVMQQVVTANQMLDEINKNGFIALYIHFATGKADLPADGQATVREIAAMLKAAPSLKIAVEGHTDNVGTAASNKALSENRARSVVSAIVASGIQANRLNAAGLGQERPIADNRSEEGRAKNRRVELVKQ